MTSPTRRRHSVNLARTNYILDMTIFTPQLLNTDEGLQNALMTLDRSWWNDEQLELVVRELMVGPHNLLEYIVAVALDEDRYDHLVSTLHRTFPSSAIVFPTSLAADLLAHLRVFYIRLLSPDLPRSLDECHRCVSLMNNALNALNVLKLDPETPTSPQQPDDIDAVRYKQSQRKAKHAKRMSRLNVVTDIAPFKAIGVEVPHTKEGVTHVASHILDEQKAVLKEYLRVLRISDLTQTIEELYISGTSATVPKDVPQNAGPVKVEEPVYQAPEIPQAYPQIQPMKAAKYFAEAADGFGPWNLLLASRAIAQLKGFHRGDQAQWAIVKKKLQELSNGFFSDSNQKRLTGTDQDVPIYEAKLTRDLRIVYQIDIAPDDATRNDGQVIKVWGILTHAQMDDRLWKSISQHQGRIGSEYRRRCNHRETPKQAGKNVILPGSWPSAVEKMPAELAEDVPMTTEHQLELHSSLALEKFTRMSQALLNSIISGQDTVYPFELTATEQEICDYPFSCFVLGRSGTGKTTTMVSKMISREMLWIQQAADAKETNVELGPKYRQLFVTQSRILAGHVQEYFGKMLMSQSAGHKTSQEIERLAQRNQRAADSENMLVTEEDEDERADLPKKFSELEDHHFPLFLTMDQLCKLLEGDCSLSFKRRPRTKEHRRAEQRAHVAEVDGDMVVKDDEDLAKDNDLVAISPSQNRTAEKASIITFDVFLYAYWRHFPQSLTKCLDPALVWNELIGGKSLLYVIKGSEEALDAGNQSTFLDKHTYLNFSHRRQSTFVKQREQVYQLFEHYTKLKREREEYDAADRTHAILRALQGKISIGRKVDYLYVDEAQDNLIIDAHLLRLLCSNPQGLFWAGDTAQTISMGSSFRFDDLKSSLFRFEERSCHSRVPARPESFQLAINHRSHAGVVNCAHSVVELITKFWPDSIDTLARERGLVGGPRPVFFCGLDPKVARYEQFLFHESGHIEFGAQQCILVRDDQARENLRLQIGEVGLVMTLYEAKGLEFNDVLLFDFFHDSTATLTEWRVILNAVEEVKRGNVPAPRFDETRHSLLRSELKSLYVGITRARSHVWILDSSETGEPMRVFWESGNLVQTCRPGDAVPELAVKSTPDQWAQQGYALFKTKHFQQAMFCFERAGLQLERAIAYAHLLRRTADRVALQEGRGVSKNAAYIRAADAFIVCAGLSSSTPATRSRYLGLAADCFLAAGSHASAAQAYLGAEEFTKAAQQFKQATLFDEAVDVILLHRAEVEPDVAKKCLNIARLHFHREGQSELAARLFESIDEQISYLEDYGFSTIHLNLLRRLGRWADAAELHYKEGRHLAAIPLWLRAGDTASKRRASDCLIDCLWRTFPLGALPRESPSQKNLLELLQSLDRDLLNQEQRDESAMFIAILTRDSTQLLYLARKFYHGLKKNPMAALLCFDQSLTSPPSMHNNSAQTLSRHLENYDSYAQLMRTVILDWQKSQAAALLGIIEADEESEAGAPAELHVLSTSILYEHLRNADTVIQTTDEYISVNPGRLSALIRQILGQRMKQRLMEEDEICGRARAFRQCLKFAITGSCGRVECPREHLPRGSLDLEAFNLRARLHMQQILLVQSMGISFGNWDHRKMQRIWQERLYETLLPTFYALGHLAGLLPTAIPEYSRALLVLSDRTRDRFYSLKPYREGVDVKFLTDFVQTAMLGFALDRANATYYTRRAACVVNYRPPFLLRNDGWYVVNDLISFLEASEEASIASGVFFIKHILDQRLSIDINALLNVLEAVIGRAIIAGRSSLHQLTLPRSWIVNLLSNWGERCKGQNVAIIRHLFDPLQDLLEAIYTNQHVDHLLYEGRPLTSIPMHVTIGRNIHIFRICRCLSLFGYNIQHEELRGRIHKTMTYVNKPGRTFSSLTVQYLKAGNWDGLARAVRASTDSPLDEMVVLCRNDRIPTIYQPPKGLRLVRFNSEAEAISEVLPILAYAMASKFNPEAKPFIPSAVAQHATTLATEVEAFVDESPVDDSFNDEKGAIEIAPQNLSVQRTEAEVEAANAIQSWYRRRLAIKSIPKVGTSEARSHIYAHSQAAGSKLQVSAPYRRMFLGPLPHALIALQGSMRAVAKTKKAVKNRLISPGRLDLDAENELFTKCRDLYNKHSRLWRNLEPASEFHREGSPDKLKQQVQEVNILIEEALAVSRDIQKFVWDMELGYKGIVRAALPPRPTLKAKRPRLNTEDIDV